MDLTRLITDVCLRQQWELDRTSITLHLDNGRRQFIHCESFAFEGEDMIRMYTRVGPLDKLSDTQLSALLGLNFSLAFGSLAAFGEDLVMTETLLLREEVRDQLAYAIRFIAETSDRYEQQIYGTDQY